MLLVQHAAKFQQQPERRRDNPLNQSVVRPEDVEEVKEESLTRLKVARSGALQQYKVADGEFTSFPEITQKTVDRLVARKITSLFPIQQQCFYPIYNREDVIARDLTGSGKTLAFALPIVEYCRKNKFLGQKRLQAIVLAPTRELALQVRTSFCHIISIGVRAAPDHQALRRRVQGGDRLWWRRHRLTDLRSESGCRLLCGHHRPSAGPHLARQHRLLEPEERDLGRG
jgi:DEAD/DEAH box helicase